MKLTISRKVVFRLHEKAKTEKAKAESITNQYVLNGRVEDIHVMMLSLLDVLNDDFTQEKKKGK